MYVYGGTLTEVPLIHLQDLIFFFLSFHYFNSSAKGFAFSMV